MTTKSTFNPVDLKGKGFSIFVLILLATLALMAIAVYSQVTTGKTVTDGFGAGETFVTNEKLVLGSRGGVGPAWHRGPKVSVAHPPVAVVGQPILQASPQANPELSFARRYATDGSVK